MGYTTQFCMDVKVVPMSDSSIIKRVNKKVLLQAINKCFNDVVHFELASSKSDHPFVDDSDGETRWYEHEENMKEFSTKYPDLLFILYGEGEESTDIWRKYFVNGKMQMASAKIVFDEFDERKLR